MTIIAAITDGQTTWMTSDNAGACNGLLITAPKISRIAVPPASTSQRQAREHGRPRELLFAAAGDRAAHVLFTQHAKIDGVPDPDNSRDCLNWAQAVAESWTGVVDSAALGPWRAGDSDNPPGIDATALLAYGGHLFRLTTNLAVHIEQRYAAIGAGADFAYGAFHALRDDILYIPEGEIEPPYISPRLALGYAVDAALTWCAHCHPPARHEILTFPAD